MERSVIEREFRDKVSKEIRFLDEGVNRFKVFTPFKFEDGDHLVIVLKNENNKWLLSDEGHTYMHLSYCMDTDSIEKGTRAKIIDTTLQNYNVHEIEGALVAELNNGDSGNVFYNYLQALLKITDITYLNRERIRSTFFEDFKNFMQERIPQERIEFNYHSVEFDPQGKYLVDCRINKMVKPFFIYAISNDDKCRDATISLLQFEKWGLQFRSMSIFEDQETINRKVLARFSDVCEKQFSSLVTNKERIEKYLQESMSN